MEKKRKRDKNGANVSNGVGDIAHTLQEQNPELKPSLELPAGVPFPAWQYPAVPPPAPQQQPGLQAPPPSQTQEALRAPVPPQPGAYWPYPGPSAFESGWPPVPPSTQSGAPGGFPFPPPGAWYPYPPPYYFGYPVAANPSANRGVIKPPQGLSQKHQKLWELQSAENVQLWATLTRVEAELASNRHRITQLEAELQTLKPKTANPDSTPANITTTTEALAPIIPAAAAAPVLAPPPLAPVASLPLPAKRGRYRKPVMGNIPPEAIAPRPRGRKPSIRQATKELIASPSTGPLSGFPAPLPDPGGGAALNGVMPSSAQLHHHHQQQQQQQLVVEHQTLSFDPSANKIRRENGSGASFLNLEVNPNLKAGEGININKQVPPAAVNWNPVMQVAAAAARAATGSDEDEEENDEDDVVLAVSNSQVRW